MNYKSSIITLILLSVLSSNHVQGQVEFVYTGKCIFINHVGLTDKYPTPLVLTVDSGVKKDIASYRFFFLSFPLDEETFNAIDSFVKSYSQLRKPAYTPERDIGKNLCWTCYQISVLASIDSIEKDSSLYGHSLSTTEESEKYFNSLIVLLQKNNGLNIPIKKELISTIHECVFYNK